MIAEVLNGKCPTFLIPDHLSERGMTTDVGWLTDGLAKVALSKK